MKRFQFAPYRTGLCVCAKDTKRPPLFAYKRHVWANVQSFNLLTSATYHPPSQSHNGSPATRTHILPPPKTTSLTPLHLPSSFASWHLGPPVSQEPSCRVPPLPTLVLHVLLVICNRSRSRQNNFCVKVYVDPCPKLSHVQDMETVVC